MNTSNQHKGHVLVVDDQENIQFILGLSLERAGYTVETAGDGLEAIKKMMHRPFHVVITDYLMPRMNGLEFLTISKLRWPDTPVVMITGDSSDTIAESATQAGAFALVHKPFDYAVLFQLLSMAVLHSRKDQKTLAATGHANEPQRGNGSRPS